jgi:hypothetical protein
MTTRTNRRGIVWAIIGGVVLAIGIAALIIASLSNNDPEPAPPSPTTTAPTDPGPTPTTDGEAVVDESVTDRGWVPEPITTDAEIYVRAALAAAGTFDTTKAEYEEWIAYLGTWFTQISSVEQQLGPAGCVSLTWLALGGSLIGHCPKRDPRRNREHRTPGYPSDAPPAVPQRVRWLPLPSLAATC